MSSTQFNSDAQFTTKTDADQLDAFSNMRTAGPTFVADGQFTYDLQPLIYEQITSGDGAIVHDSTERAAKLSIDTATGSGDEAIMQSYQYHKYQSGRAQEIFLTFNFNDNTGVSNLRRFAEYGDGDNAIGFELNETAKNFYIKSDTTEGDETVAQASWSIDPMDGTGPSGKTLDTSKTQILVISVQALYTGEVRIGFDIDGDIIWCHEFQHANLATNPYIQTANLPIRVGMESTGITTTLDDMLFICSCVLSRGGQVDVAGYDFSESNTEIAVSSGARTHALSIQPKATFNSITNRIEFKLKSINVVAETNPILWELCLGDVITGTTTFTDVNATYSAFQKNTAGTTSGSPAAVISSGVVAASNQASSGGAFLLDNRFPITLDASGSVRTDRLGTLTLLLTGIGGAATGHVTMNWKELQ